MPGEDDERDEFGLLIRKKPLLGDKEREVEKKPSPKLSPKVSPSMSPALRSPEKQIQVLIPPPPPFKKTPGPTAIEGGYKHERAASSKSNESGEGGEGDNKQGSIIKDGGVGSSPKPKPTVSEYSHLALVTKKEEPKKEDIDLLDDEWQEMPAYASTDLYDDDGRLIAREAQESDADGADELRGGARKGYTRVNDDDDKESVTSMDENTSYLFDWKVDDEASKTPLSQMQATKELLTEGQRIAYVGVCRLAMVELVKEQERLNGGKGKQIKKALGMAVEHTRMWAQKIIHRLYVHMDISTDEQIMIEQLAEHGVLPSDLTPALMKNSRVSNPLNEQSNNPRASVMSQERLRSPSIPPPYEQNSSDDLGDVKSPNMLSETKTLDIDLRWTILCDLFLVLIADSVYDARSRVLLEKVGKYLNISWLEICKFEKKVTDALEVQEAAEQNWSEEEHMENRRKASRNRRYMMMGLATIGGGLVIGLSGGLLAPVIGAGLAAGFTTIGVAGTTTFLAGAGGTAIIASTAVVSGATIGGKASLNRTAHVKTFEYRPLHNSKRVNLIITVSGWMSGKEDDVRLPFSTVDPLMGDLFSVLWEPEMLKSMGQTINILATEVLTQSLQQVLGSTVLVALMASIQLPVVLTKLSYLLDNPWSVSLDRAIAAGLILADSLIGRNLGVRPVTLVGYSLGARVIYSCLRELHRRHAYGLVQSVYMFGSPVVVKKDEYAKARTAVAGRFVNGYATNDWILGYLFRATSGGIGRVAGLAPIEDIEGVENVNVTDLVEGHMAYRQAIPKLLRRVGWIVVDDEFQEIEEPDPDQHHERQRELINELDAARKELEKEPTQKGKGLFGLFGRKNQDIAKKKDWETYKPDSSDTIPSSTTAGAKKLTNAANAPPSPRTGLYDDVLFDVDAIRAEIAQQAAEERNSPQKFAHSLSVPSTPANLRHVRSFESPAAKGLNISTEGGGSLSKPSSHLHSPVKPGLEKGGKDAYYYSDDDEDEFGNRRGGAGDDGEIQMTFGRWDEPPPHPKTVGTYGYGYGGGVNGGEQRVVEIPKRSSSYGFGPVVGGGTFSSSSWNTAKTDTNANTHAHSKADKVAVRAVIGGVTGVMAGMAAMSMSESSIPSMEPQKNVWANDDYYDDYDEDEFAEKEVTMSFA
ncbi:hypothetical protein EV426DRAFT_712363 [Tirmania nivea]|nr:hypothetical protein EV426DRAFT_712363 [Tirmania nivea]